MYLLVIYHDSMPPFPTTISYYHELLPYPTTSPYHHLPSLAKTNLPHLHVIQPPCIFTYQCQPGSLHTGTTLCRPILLPPYDTTPQQLFKVNGKIYTADEAALLGTTLTVESFEAVLDEDGDVKNTVMYLVASGPIGDIPLEVKWWTGRLDASNKQPLRELGEMAIADWGDAHRNTTPRILTKHTHKPIQTHCI